MTERKGKLFLRKAYIFKRTARLKTNVYSSLATVKPPF